ncbi:hypothetical protein [Lonepinella sp. BR2357]|uniref:hypothetical protein n=1 Tax=Lonepinella sp. BR2357 TaxID=3434549 RepID=UPI003F6E072D
MAKTVLTQSDLNTDDFYVENKQVRIYPKLPTPTEYLCLFVSGKANANSSNEIYRKLYVQGNYGYIHLDFRPVTVSGNVNIATLPTNAPTPSATLEVQTFDGGNVWIDKDSRKIYASGLTTGQRYTVNIPGYFNV